MLDESTRNAILRLAAEGHGTRAISKALREEQLNKIEEWVCAKCGMKWTPEMHGTIRHWMPRPYFIVVRPRL